MATVGITNTRDVLRHVDSRLAGGSSVDTVELRLGSDGDDGEEAWSSLGESTWPTSGVESGDGESSRMGGGRVREPEDEERLLEISSRLILRFMSVAGFLMWKFRRCADGLGVSGPPNSSRRGLGGSRRFVSEPCLLWPRSICSGEGLRVSRILRVNSGTPAFALSCKHRFLVAELKYLINHTHSQPGTSEHSQPCKNNKL